MIGATRHINVQVQSCVQKCSPHLPAYSWQRGSALKALSNGSARNRPLLQPWRRSRYR